jgi:hypothetical protein
MIDAARQTGLRYFEIMATFQSPDDAKEAAVALAEVGYVFEQTPYVFDEEDGILLTPTVYGIISGHTAAASERALFGPRNLVPEESADFDHS